jgi:hypothetical protein
MLATGAETESSQVLHAPAQASSHFRTALPSGPAREPLANGLRLQISAPFGRSSPGMRFAVFHGFRN